MFPATLALIELTTPAMLGGLALASLPVIAHLLNRRARRRIVFPTIVLLRASTAAQSRLFRFRRWLLLLLRCLAVAMIALAFARPVWLDARRKESVGGKGTAAVLVIDVSASTAQNAAGVSVFNGLRASALRTIDSLAAGTDVADAVVASARPRAVFPTLSSNLPGLREELNRLRPTNERSDLPQAMTLAIELLASHSGPRRLVILSDLQQTNWHDLVGGGRMPTPLPPATEVTVIDVDTPVPDNVALSSTRHLPSQPLVDQNTQLVVQVANFSGAAKDVRLDVQVDGLPAQSSRVVLGAHEQRDISVDWVLKGEGDHEVTFEIPADGLAVDNRAFLTVKARQRLPVVILSDDNPNEPGTASYFLTRALSPHGDAKTDRFDVRNLRASQLSDSNLADSPAVFVGYLGELTPSAAGTLINFLRRGGGVLFFSGEGTVRQNLQMLQQTAGNLGVLPWDPGPARVMSGPDRALAITNGKWRNRLLREFDEQSQIVFSQIRFSRVWSAGAAPPDADILLSFSDGTPALGSRPVEAGQFLLANFSPSAEASDLGKYGSFVALVQTLAQQLRPTADAGSANAVAGELYRHPQPFHFGPGSGRLTVLDPDKEPVPFTVSTNAGDAMVQLSQTGRPGFYRFRMGDKPVAVAAINVDKRESNLARIGRDDLLRCYEKEGSRVAVQSAGGWEPLSNQKGTPLWGLCLAVAMTAVGIELFCLGYWRR